jgi:hypothetical protein
VGGLRLEGDKAVGVRALGNDVALVGIGTLLAVGLFGQNPAADGALAKGSRSLGIEIEVTARAGYPDPSPEKN